MNNPWEDGHVFCGVKSQYCGVEDRLSIIKNLPPTILRAALAWPDTQKTVRLALERRLRKLSRMNAEDSQ